MSGASAARIKAIVIGPALPCYRALHLRCPFETLGTDMNYTGTASPWVPLSVILVFPITQGCLMFGIFVCARYAL